MTAPAHTELRHNGCKLWVRVYAQQRWDLEQMTSSIEVALELRYKSMSISADVLSEKRKPVTKRYFDWAQILMHRSFGDDPVLRL